MTRLIEASLVILKDDYAESSEEDVKSQSTGVGTEEGKSSEYDHDGSSQSNVSETLQIVSEEPADSDGEL